jgi:hypothetical protein
LLTDTQQAALLADTQESARGDLHATMNRNLRKGWLQNVFAYGTERTLFKQALVDRGAEDRYAALTQRADEIRALVEERWNARQAALQVIASTLLAFLSGLAVKDALYDFVAPEKPKEPLYVALAIALLVAVVVGWMGWLASRRRKLARSR